MQADHPPGPTYGPTGLDKRTEQWDDRAGGVAMMSRISSRKMNRQADSEISQALHVRHQGRRALYICKGFHHQIANLGQVAGSSRAKLTQDFTFN